MSSAERQQSLANARKACEWLEGRVEDCRYEEWLQVNCLVTEFKRLDAGEQKRNEAGRKFGKLGAKHGKKGGRPRKDKAE